MSSGSSSRPPRRDDSRPSGSGRSKGPSGGSTTSGNYSGGKSSGGTSSGRPSAGAKRSGGQGPGGKSSGGKSSGGTSGGRSSGRQDYGGSRGANSSDRGRSSSSDRGRSSSGDRRGRPTKPLTEAERRALEVKARRAPREPRDPEHERRKIEERTTEQWIDEGSVRRAAAGATARAATPANDERAPRRANKPLDPEVSAELVDALGSQRGARLAERLAQASEALDRERFQEARRIATAIAKEAPSVSAAHEIVGLSSYRLGLYKQAVGALQSAQDLHQNPALLPVIADCQRAQGHWTAVDDVWREIREASPSHEVMAEGRMVAAGALADQDELRAALTLMEPAMKRPKTVRDYNVRQWYVIADLYDRMGDPINARRWFGAVADYDDEFADTMSRLRALGR